MSSARYRMSKTEQKLGVMNTQPLAHHVQTYALQRHQHNVEHFLFQRQGPEMNIRACSTGRSETDFFERANGL